MTKGTKNILEAKTTLHLTKFWELHKLAKKQNLENAIRTKEKMKAEAEQAFKNFEIDKDNKFLDYILGFVFGEVVENKFGKKLYFKLDTESVDFQQAKDRILNSERLKIEVIENQQNLK